MSRFALFALWLSLAMPTQAADWPRFRGENGSGLAAAGAKPPIEWSESKNLKWSAKLPGPGKSSPIVVGNRVIVTCWSSDNPPENLKRHLLCFDRETGNELWSKSIEPEKADEDFRGMFTENGYASHTPVSDGQRIYAFFGLDGVRAFDMDGNELWHTTVGEGRDRNGWGTASSPILYNNLVIVPACSESTAIFALNKDDGKQVWRQEANALQSLWGTPVLVTTSDGKQELAYAVPGEVWGMNPDTGKLRWYAEGSPARNLRSSAVVDKDVVYAVGEMGGNSMAVRAAGKGDVTKTNVLWTSNQRGGVGTPIVADGLLYTFNNGVVSCLDSATGEQVYSKRLEPPAKPQTEDQVAAAAPPTDSAAPPANNPPVQGFGRPGEFADPATARGGFGGFGRGGMRGQDYSSPVLADGKLYFIRRSGDVYVLAAGRDYKVLAVNKFDSDDGDFSSTPAIVDGAIFIRSSNKLYCIAE
jgi:outer membrane protein assembly factor BamB